MSPPKDRLRAISKLFRSQVRAPILRSTIATVILPVPHSDARSLEISGDGQYYVITCNDPAKLNELIVYRISYESRAAIENFAVIQDVDVGSGSHSATLLIDTN